MQGIIQYYEEYDEASRLTTDYARSLEFITTTHFLDKYIGEHDNILDLGAGTGIYTFYYADKGNPVASTDLTPKHVSGIRRHILEKSYRKVTAEIADATDLSRYPSDFFNAVLCLGPMYHLLEKSVQQTCVQECLRVLKPGGILAAAYVNRLFIFPSLVQASTDFLNERWMKLILEDKTISSADADCFWTDAYFHTPDEMESLFEPFDVEKLEHVAADGIGRLLNTTINNLTTDQFDLWKSYHLRTCSEPSALGMSNHGLYICRKR